MRKLAELLLVVSIIASSCTPLPTPSNNTLPADVNPWTNVDVFSMENPVINATAGHEFVIKFFSAASSIDYQAPDIAIVKSTKFISNPGTPHGKTWFLLEALAAGTTNISITPVTRFGDKGSPIIFTVHVAAAPGTTPAENFTGNPGANVQVFTGNDSINVTVGQEFVILYSQFTSSNISFQPSDIVIFKDKHFVQNPGIIIPDGTTWIRFKAIAEGSTRVSVTMTTRFGDPLQTKAIEINVSPVVPSPDKTLVQSLNGERTWLEMNKIGSSLGTWGTNNYLVIGSNGYVRYVEDQGVRILPPGDYVSKTTRIGNISATQLNRLEALADNCTFDSSGNLVARPYNRFGTDQIYNIYIGYHRERTIVCNFVPISNGIMDMPEVPEPLRIFLNELRNIIENNTIVTAEEHVTYKYGP